MSDMFYRAFEERYRGSRELIKQRLETYLPFIEPFKALYTQPAALDLGCGRGEWLELLQENGFQAQGIDLDEGMLLACKERHLAVAKGDAIEHIKTLPNDSLCVISAFHFVEHIPFEKLRELMHEAQRVLAPGGLLILETPNSENLLVGTSSFYMDPTHQQPIPAQLLAFLAEYVKFARVKTLYLQERCVLPITEPIGLSHILEDVSPDYALIAQKQAAQTVYALFNADFEREYGNRLLALAKRYDEQIKTHIEWCHNEWFNLKKSIAELQAINNTSSVLTKNSTSDDPHDAPADKNELPNYLLRFWEQKVCYLEQKVEALRNELKAVYSSTSWRATALLRQISPKLKQLCIFCNRLAQRALSLIKTLIKKTSLKAIKVLSAFLSKTGLKQQLYRTLNRYPSLKRLLRRVITRFNLMDKMAHFLAFGNSHKKNSTLAQKTGDDLSPYADYVYNSLLKLIKPKE